MRVFAHPLRLDNDGAIATVEQWSVQQASQVALAIVSTPLGERSLAPDFGLPDPVGVGISQDTVIAAMDLCEPDLELDDVQIQEVGADGTQEVRMTVFWRDNDDEVV